jgi:hypothetical protein
MRTSWNLLIMAAALAIQPAWAHGHDDRRAAPGLMQQPQFQHDPRQLQPQYPAQYPRAPAAAFGPRSEPQFARPQNEFSPGDAARRAQQMNGGGRILAVDPNGPGYRVKVLKEGEVRVIAVPGG